MFITRTLLRKVGACTSDRLLFDEWIAGRKGVELCDKEIVAAAAYGLDVIWLCVTVGYKFSGKLVTNGHTLYYKNNWLHRTNGPAFISYASKSYWKHGKRHRVNGPAIISLGFKEWWRNGLRYKRKDRLGTTIYNP